MQKLILLGIAAACITTSAAQKNAHEPYWLNPSVNRIGTEAPRADFFAFESITGAQSGDKSESKRYMTLEGKWKFKFSIEKSAADSFRSSSNFENRLPGHKIGTKSLEISLFTPFGGTPNRRAFCPSSRPLYSRFLLNHEIALTVLSLPDAPKAGILASEEAGESLALLISFSNFTPASCAAFLRPWT